MNRRTVAVMGIVSAFLTVTNLVLGASGSDEKEQLQSLRAKLTDGSDITGTTIERTIPLKTPYLAVDLPLNIVAGIGFSSSNATVRLKNGDQLTGSLGVDHLELRTLLGQVSIRCSNIVSMTFFNTSHGLRPASGLVLHLAFDEADGATPADSSGRNHTVTIKNGARIASAEGRDHVLVLDGRDSHVRIEGSEDFSMDNFTFAAWVMPDTWTLPDNCCYPILSTLTPYRETDGGWELDLGSNSILMHIAPIGGALRYSSASVDFDKTERMRWHHVACTGTHEEGGYTLNFYIDGKWLKTERAQGGLAKCKTNMLFVGVDYDSPASGFGRYYMRQFRGAIDDLMIYNRALSPEEVSVLHEATSQPGSRPHPVEQRQRVAQPDPQPEEII